MTAEALRKRLSSSDIEALGQRVSLGRSCEDLLREVVGSVAEGYGDRWREVVDAAPSISEIADRMLRAASVHGARRQRLKSDGFHEASSCMVGEWCVAAKAASRLSAGAHGPDPLVLGGLSEPGADDDVLGTPDDMLVASVLAVAIEETLDADAFGDREAIRSLFGAMGDVPEVAGGAWNRLGRRHMRRMRGHARLIGHAEAAASVRSLMTFVTLKGQALQGRRDGMLLHALGAAGLEAISRPARTERGLPAPARLGAAAMAATYGFLAGFHWNPAGKTSVIEPSRPLEEFDRFDGTHPFDFVLFGLMPARFTWAELAPLTILRIPAAVSRLDEIVVSPHIPEGRSARYAALAAAVRHDGATLPDTMPFGRLLGIREFRPETGELIHGIRLFRASPTGRYPAGLTTEGRAGREMRLEAVADAAGRLVGYAGVDPLSEEFHGLPERYVYDLEGWRRGCMIDGLYRHGLPRKRMMTAPEGIELAL